MHRRMYYYGDCYSAVRSSGRCYIILYNHGPYKCRHRRRLDTHKLYNTTYIRLRFVLLVYINYCIYIYCSLFEIRHRRVHNNVSHNSLCIKHHLPVVNNNNTINNKI